MDSSPLLLGVEAVLRRVGSGSWGMVDAAGRFITRWHRGDAEKSWLRHAAEDAKTSDKEDWGAGAAVLTQLSMSADTKS